MYIIVKRLQIRSCSSIELSKKCISRYSAYKQIEGLSFFAEKGQRKLMEYGIKFRPNKPGSPHLNGKAELSHRTDKEEFYSTVNLDLEELKNETLPEWQHYFNWQRGHGSFKGKTPMHIVCEHLEQTPLWEEVNDDYKSENEWILLSNHQRDLQLRKLK